MSIFDLSFTDRASYLAWRAEWKQLYKDFSLEVRKQKIAVKDANRAYSKGGSYNALLEAIRVTHGGRAQMRELLTALYDGKRKANQQWLAAQEKTHA